MTDEPFAPVMPLLDFSKLDDVIAFGSPITGLVTSVAERRAPMTTAAMKPLRKNSYSKGTKRNMLQLFQKFQSFQSLNPLAPWNLWNGWSVWNHALRLAVRRVGPLADHDHAVVMKDHHFAAVGLFEHGGVENLLRPAFGSHNLRSVTHALVLAKEKRVPERAYEVEVRDLAAGEERLVSAEIQAQRYGRHVGEITAQSGAESLSVQVRTVTFP